VPPLGPKLAIMTLRYALIVILMLPALPAWAGEPVQHAEHDELNFDEPFEQATKSVLRSLLNRALDLIENHIEITGNVQPNKETGEQQGHFQLKLYPQGKSQSDDHFSAELRFRSFPDDRGFSFDLNLPKEPSKNSPFSPTL
jgi:hypothetical protein